MSDSLLTLTAQIVAAHLSHNEADAAFVPELINTVYRSLSSAGTVTQSLLDAPEPAVPVKKSVFPDYIVCLEDGKKLKMLKRHLKTSFGMTPEQYRTKWGLPAGYPMVAPNYASQRSSLAKKIGLGRKPASDSSAAAETEPQLIDDAEPVVTMVKARKARGSKG